jgi:starvation-inducible outer membrane lipoprotein
MRKALAYFYEVKKNSTEKANGGIGIIPYVYNNAYNYYYNIWMANQTNNAKPIEQYQPQERVIKIPPPKRVEKKKKLFSFLDEEG